jgi:hypothetical protein
MTKGNGQFSTSEGEMTDKIISTVAKKENTDPANLRPSLYTAVDPDALESLIQHDGNPISVTFTYLGWDIDVQRNEINVTERSEEE